MQALRRSNLSSRLAMLPGESPTPRVTENEGSPIGGHHGTGLRKTLTTSS